MGIIRFLKTWTLPSAMMIGAAVYFLFTLIEPLKAPGEFLGPYMLKLMPVLIFIILYITFCKIRIDNLKPQVWHFWLQGIRTALSGLMVLLMALTDNPDVRIVLMGVFICFICPTAATAPVVTEKLGGSIESLTVYTLIANIVTALIIPTFFPLVEKDAGITFGFAFMMILKRVVTVLLLPLCLALLTRKFLPKFAAFVKQQGNVAFYIWGANLSIVMGMTMHNIMTASVGGFTLLLLLVLPLGVTILQFAIGKGVGSFYGQSISAGQALGQKNTVVGIWLTMTFLNPTAAVAPSAYVIWQNLVNAWQLWYKGKYGTLKW